MKKILIIEDIKEDFDELCGLLGNSYTILPEKFDEMASYIEYRNLSVVEFVIQQIDQNYKDIFLVLCDIQLGTDVRGGNKVVKAIRAHEIPSSPNWTSLVPIIAITGYAEYQPNIIEAGADYSLTKDTSKYLISTIVDGNVESFIRRLESMYPPRLKNEIKAFKERHLNDITAFIMTSFAEEHQETIKQITDILKENNITPFLADKQGGEHCDDLWSNIEVFIHGCDFGIGIYADDSILKDNDKIDAIEHLRRIRINPNMSQEVGYMLGIRKKVCILKDKKLDKLPIDLAGKIYVEYKDKNDLKNKLCEWLNIKIFHKR